MPCITAPLNLLETSGTRSRAFDFQLRPVGHSQSHDPVMGLLRFKDFVSKHEHGRVNLTKSFSKDHASAVCRTPAANWNQYGQSGIFLKRKLHLSPRERVAVGYRGGSEMERGAVLATTPVRADKGSPRFHGLASPQCKSLNRNFDVANSNNIRPLVLVIEWPQACSVRGLRLRLMSRS